MSGSPTRVVLALLLTALPQWGCYDSHSPPLLSSVPEDWLANPEAHAEEIYALLCQITIASRTRLRCPEDCWSGDLCDGRDADAMLENCERSGRVAADSGCLDRWIEFYDCSETTILDTCEANPTTWPCFDEEEAMWDCIYP